MEGTTARFAVIGSLENGKLQPTDAAAVKFHSVYIHASEHITQFCTTDDSYPDVPYMCIDGLFTL